MSSKLDLPEVFHVMMSHSLMSRLTVTASTAKMALSQFNRVDGHETAVIRSLLTVESHFRQYFDAQHKEVELQRIAAQTLWHLIQRYMIAMEVDTSCTCPQIYEIETEEAIMNKYYMHYQVIAGSNKSQRWALQALRPFVLDFRSDCEDLDLEKETPLTMGDAFHKPIQFHMNLVDEIFNYFLAAHLQLDCAARLLDPLDLKSLEYYQKLLAPNEDFDEYFMHNMCFCKCLRAPPNCPAGPVDEKKDKKEVRMYIPQARKARCARRVAKMGGQRKNTQAEEVPPSPEGTPAESNSANRMSSMLGHATAMRTIHERSVTDQLRHALSISMPAQIHLRIIDENPNATSN